MNDSAGRATPDPAGVDPIDSADSMTWTAISRPNALQGMIETGSFHPDIFDQVDGVYTPEFAERLRSIARYTVEARPVNVPANILALPDGTEVLVRDEVSDRVELVEHLKERIRATVERQKSGYFTLQEAASILAIEQGSNADALREEMEFAFADGALIFLDGQTRLPLRTASLVGPYSETYGERWAGHVLAGGAALTTPEAIDRWLDGIDPERRLPRFSLDDRSEGASGTCKRTSLAEQHDEVVEVQQSQSWAVFRPERDTCYSHSLYMLLKEAHSRGAPKPTATDVLEAFRKDKPDEVEEMLPCGFRYKNALGQPKKVDKKALAAAIRRMTTSERPGKRHA